MLAGIRRRAWEVGRRRAAALQQAAPLAAAAAGSGGGTGGGNGGGSEHVPQQAAEVQQLRRVLRKQTRRRGADAHALGSSTGGRHGSLPASAILGGSPANPAHLPLASRRGGAVDGGRGAAVHRDDGTRPLVPLPLSPRARLARMEQSVAVNKQVCRMFDELHRRLNSGTLPPAQRLAEAQACVDAVGQSLHSVGLGDVNMSTFFHRIARLVCHPAMQQLRGRLDTSRVMSVLIQRFEGLLDRVLRQEARQAAAAEGGAPAAERDAAAVAAAAGPQLRLSPRSLAVSFWALGTMRHPLRQEMLDKIAGVAMLRYGELSSSQISMLVVALQAYNNKPFGGKLLKVLLERTAHLPVEQFEARQLLSIVCAAGAGGVVASQAALDRLSLAALANLNETDSVHLGSLVWGLAKLSGKAGARRIHSPILHAATVAAWRRMHELSADALSHLLQGFAALYFHPGEAFLDAAAARMRQLLPTLTGVQVANSLWAFARLDYSPAASRDLWAISSSRGTGGGAVLSASWAGRPGGSTRFAGILGGAEMPEARGAGGGGGAGSQAGLYGLPRQAHVADHLGSQATLAERVLARREARRQAGELLAHARGSVAAALARSRAGQEQVLAPVGDKVDEEMIGELAAAIMGRPRGALQRWRVLAEPRGGQAGLQERMDARSGVATIRPFYTREQIYDFLTPLSLPPLERQPAEQGGEADAEAAAAAAAEELLHRIRQAKAEATERTEARRVAAAAAAAAAAATTGELQRLDAFLAQAEGEAEEGAELAEAAGDGQRAEAADSLLLEDSELDDAELEEGGGGAGGPAGGAAGAPPLDLDAVQRQEEDVERLLREAEEEEEEESDVDGLEDEGERADGGQEDVAAIAARLQQPGQPLAAAAAGAAQTVARAAQQRLHAEQRAKAEAGEAAASRALLKEERRLRHRERRQAERAARREAAALEAQAWRSWGLPPDRLLERLLEDGNLLTVPRSTRRRWEGEQRVSLDEVAAHTLPLVPRMHRLEVASLLWAYASMRHVHPELFQALHQRAMQIDMSWRGIAILMWSSAVALQPPPAGLVDVIFDKHLPACRRRCQADGGGATSDNDIKSLSNISWSLAALDLLTPRRFRELTSLVPADEGGQRGITEAAWCQFFQGALYLEGKTGRHYSEFLPPHMLAPAEAAWQSRDTTTSRLQNKVADVLLTLGVPFSEEYSPRANFFGIDIAIQENGVKLAVEVDGPQHFASNPPHAPLASTHLRNSLLEKHGWQVISIPFNVWAKLEGLQEQQEYLKEHVLKRLGK